MKVALLFLDGVSQVVLTPETDYEKSVLKFVDGEVEIHRGSFYQGCRGGWYREFEDDHSLIILQKKKVKEVDV